MAAANISNYEIEEEAEEQETATLVISEIEEIFNDALKKESLQVEVGGPRNEGGVKLFCGHCNSTDHSAQECNDIDDMYKDLCMGCGEQHEGRCGGEAMRCTKCGTLGHTELIHNITDKDALIVLINYWGIKGFENKIRGLSAYVQKEKRESRQACQ